MRHVVMFVRGATAGPWTEVPANGAVVVINFADLTPALLGDHLPDSIVLPLFAEGFDALDALARLAEYGFKGPVIVTCPPLPNPTLIAAELSAAGPGMVLSLIAVPPQTGLSR